MSIEKLSDEDIKETPVSSSLDDAVLKKVDVSYNVDFSKAVHTTLLDPWSKRAFKLYFIVMVGFLNAVSSGFDGSLMSGINAMDQYLNYFGYDQVGVSTGIVFMIYIVGNVVGALFAGPLSDMWGRRGGMFTGGFFILLGVAIISSAQNIKAFLGGRFILGFGISISTTAAPTWVTELAPPQWRGRLGGLYNSCFFIGSIPATGAMIGTQKMNSTWAWRLPLILADFPTDYSYVLLLASALKVPRWYVQKGQLDKAREVLVRYHSNDGKTNPIIERQLAPAQGISAAITVKKREPFWDYSGLFNNRNSRWRMLCLVLMVNGQLAGNGLITYFLPTLMSNAGVKSKHQQLVYNFANSILSAFGAFSGAAVTDRTGRRRRLYIGAFTLAVLLAMVAALSSAYGKSDNTNTAGANASITMVFLFGVVYSFTYTPLQALYCAEVLRQDIRAKGMGVHILISNIAGFINTFANSVGLERLGWKYYFVFVGWDLVASVLWFLFCVETRGRTLEELDEVFNSPWPAMASARKIKVAVKTLGDVDVLE
ncbi:general substrate transporter [Desarmillaria tabescens]|uniref:General substrate transporter n=1 Tax=Armillaria tabescens TaxID=1929756 RepID=A0AA39JI11_ARMTA|nr:general substrate transporter [Desarmillaria tabescens]KAK0440863.1 general substrate transporter [Desarmillaria tabescens]